MLGLVFEAGNDLAMICHRIDQLAQARDVIEKLPRPHLDRALASVARFKTGLAAPETFSEEAFRKTDDEIWKLRVAVLGEERAAQRSTEEGSRSPVELY
jgi:beta-glucosidase-like glycosyl hydrolase